MITYIDTSFLIKVLVAEDGSDEARQLWLQAADLAAVALIAVEARAALAAARRSHRLSAAQHRAVVASLHDLTDQLDVIRVTDELVDRAGDLAESEALRGDDAVHLAAAVTVGAVVMASADTSLCAAAMRLGLHVANPIAS